MRSKLILSAIAGLLGSLLLTSPVLQGIGLKKSVWVELKPSTVLGSPMGEVSGTRILWDLGEPDGAVPSGWVLLPPTELARLRVLVPSGGLGAGLLEVVLHNAEKRTFRRQVGAGESLDWEIALDPPMSVVGLGTRLGVFIALALGLAAAAVVVVQGLSGVARVKRARGERSAISPFALAGVALFSIFYHLVYAVYAPWGHSSDSLEYYAAGKNLAATWDLSVVPPFRTPGYPLLVAFAFKLFGEGLWGPIVLQQLALSLLGPAAAWALAPHLGQTAAVLAGALVSVSPLLTLQGNMLWTESLFATVLGLLTFTFLRGAATSRGQWSRWIGLGLLSAALCWVRPNGVVVVPLVLLSLALHWTHLEATATPRWKRAVVYLGVFVLAIFPRLAHVHSAGGGWSLASAQGLIPGTESAPPVPSGRASSMSGIVTWINGTYQRSGRLSVATYPILAPLGGFFASFDPQGSVGIFDRVPWTLAGDARFTGEATRQYLRSDFADTLQLTWQCLKYNVWLTPPSRPRTLFYNDVFGMADRFRGLIPRVSVGKELDARLLEEAQAHDALQAGSVRSALLAPLSKGRGVFRLLILANLLLVALLFVRRELLSLAWIPLAVAAFVLAPSMLGMAIDRYVLVVEPLLWAGLVASGLCAVRVVTRVRLGRTAKGLAWKS